LGIQPRFQFVIGFFETFLVDGKFKGLSKSHYTQDLDLYCRSYGDQKNSFHLKAGQATQKTSSNIFLEIKRKLYHIR
jgi:hypothetical protein